MTYAVDEAGDLQALLVEREDPGVTVTPAEPVGMRTAGAASIIFDDVFEPSSSPRWRVAESAPAGALREM